MLGWLATCIVLLMKAQTLPILHSISLCTSFFWFLPLRQVLLYGVATLLVSGPLLLAFHNRPGYWTVSQAIIIGYRIKRITKLNVTLTEISYALRKF